MFFEVGVDLDDDDDEFAYKSDFFGSFGEVLCKLLSFNHKFTNKFTRCVIFYITHF